MKKILRMLSVQLWAALGDLLVIGKTGKKKPVYIYIGALVFIIVLSAVSYYYSYMLGTGLKMLDSLELLPAIIFTAACFATLITTVFKVKGTVFGFRDYDLLMSLPVSTASVIACRLIILYCFNFMFTFILMLPMMIAYGRLASPGTDFYIMSLLLIFFAPLIPQVLASVIGTFIAYLASKFRHSNLLNIIFSISIVFLFVGLQFVLNGESEKLASLGQIITQQLYRLYPPARLYTRAVTGGDWVYFLLFIAISIAAFAVYTFIVKLLFKKINTLLMTARARADFKLGELKTASPIKALYIRELKRYFSSSIYVLNTAIGIVMLTVMSVAGLFVDLDAMLGGEQALELLKNNLALCLVFFIMLSCTTMASISLEGKSFWIIKSLPVAPMKVFYSKIAVNLTVCLPALLDVVLLGIIFRLSMGGIILLLLIAAAASLLIAMYGLIINLMLPNFSWTAPVVAVKQSASTMVTIFSGFAFVALYFLFASLLPSELLANLGYLIFLLLVDLTLYIILKGYGIKRFNAL